MLVQWGDFHAVKHYKMSHLSPGRLKWHSPEFYRTTPAQGASKCLLSASKEKDNIWNKNELPNLEMEEIIWKAKE